MTITIPPGRLGASVDESIGSKRASPGRCPVCASTTFCDVTERRDVPVHQHMLFDSSLDARSAPRGQLNVVACLECEFVFNAAFNGALMSYGCGYESDQSYSPRFTSHIDDLLDLLLNKKRIRESRIVEVGCGKGAFLRALVEAPERNNSGIGFDPSYAGPTSDLNGRLRFERAFYSAAHSFNTADVAIFRHVIEHVADPVALLAQIRSNSDNLRIFMETKDVAWVLRHAVIWDFFYEYCSYFSQRSLATAIRRAGYGDVVSEHIFGGQYLWVEASAGDKNNEVDARPGFLEGSIRGYALREQESRTRWTQTLTSLRERAPVALWGAGAKGVTFASLFDPEAQILSCVVDLNPAKQGRFIAGSGHAVVAPSMLRDIGVRNVVLLNPIYRDEVTERLAREQLEVALITDPLATRVA